MIFNLDQTFDNNQKVCRERVDNHVLCVYMLLHVPVLVCPRLGLKKRHAEKKMVVVV